MKSAARDTNDEPILCGCALQWSCVNLERQKDREV